MQLFRGRPVGVHLCSHHNSIHPHSPLLVILKTFGPPPSLPLADATYRRVDHAVVQLAGRYYMAQPLSHTPDRGITLSAAFLLRQLMVWKVFAPRYMLGVVELLCVDVLVTVGLWLGVVRIMSRIICMICVTSAERVYQRAK